tara:strand:+ start:10009 stop:11928 length:1920 start_codon:yes stop_codon:yes gene_type:complete
MKRHLLLTSALFSSAILASTAAAQDATTPAISSTLAVRVVPAAPSTPVTGVVPVVATAPVALTTVQDAAPQDDRGYLGIHMGQEEGGIRVTRVMDGGPAARAGLEAGDLILKVAGKSMGASNEGAMEHLQSLDAGDRVRVTLMRGEERKNRWLRLRTLSDIQGQVTGAPALDPVIATEIATIERAEAPVVGRRAIAATEISEAPQRGRLIQIAVDEDGESSSGGIVLGLPGTQGKDLEGLDEDLQKQLEQYLIELELEEEIELHEGGLGMGLEIELDDLHEEIMLQGLGGDGPGHRIITLDSDALGLKRWLRVTDAGDGEDHIIWSVGDGDGVEENVIEWVVESDGDGVPHFFHEQDGDGDGGHFIFEVAEGGEHGLWAMGVEDKNEVHGHDHEAESYLFDVTEAHGDGGGGRFLFHTDEHMPKGLRGKSGDMQGHYRVVIIENGKKRVHEGNLEDLHEHLGELHGIHPGVGIAIVEDEDEHHGGQHFGLGYVGDDEDDALPGRWIRSGVAPESGQKSGQQRIERIRWGTPHDNDREPRIEMRRRIERHAGGVPAPQPRWLERTEADPRAPRAPRAPRQPRSIRWDVEGSPDPIRWAKPAAPKSKAADVNAELIHELRALREEIQELRNEVRRLRREVD